MGGLRQTHRKPLTLHDHYLACIHRECLWVVSLFLIFKDTPRQNLEVEWSNLPAKYERE